MTEGIGRLIHRALLYTAPEAMLEVVVPFLQQGLAAGEVILVVVPETTATALRDQLGADADAIAFRDAVHWYSQPTRTIAAYNSFIDDHPGVRIRALAEPSWHCHTSAELTEWTRYESIVNQAFAAIDGSVLCLYDRSGTASEVLTGALLTHPELIDAVGPCANEAYREPNVVYTDIDRLPLPPAPSDAREMQVDSIDLAGLRAFVGHHAEEHGISQARLHDLLVATTEVATNAIRHGLPPVTCRTWADDGDLVVDVTDSGHWQPEGPTGFLPPDPLVRAGFGLWGVRMLCPLVQLRTGPNGTDIRLRVRAH